MLKNNSNKCRGDAEILYKVLIPLSLTPFKYAINMFAGILKK